MDQDKVVCLIDADSLLYYEMGKETLGEAIEGLSQRLSSILEACETDSYLGYLTQGKCFRYDIYPEYKAKRKASSRSEIFYDLLDFAKTTLNFHSVPKLEADDIVSILSSNMSRPTVICSPDKDVLQQCPGRHYNYQKATFVTTTTEEANTFLWVQTVMGDATDNIKGIPGVGVKTAENWMKNRSKNLESFALSKYVEYYDNSHQGITEFYKNYSLVKLLRSEYDLELIGLKIEDIPQDICVVETS